MKSNQFFRNAIFLKGNLMKFRAIRLLFGIVLIIAVSLPVSAQNLWPYQDETTAKYGYKNENEEIVVECKYDHSVEFFSENGIARIKHNDLYAYINQEGKIVTDWFDEAPLYFEESSLIRKDGKYNIIRFNGKLLYKEFGMSTYTHMLMERYIVYKQNIWQFIKYNGKLYKEKYEDT